MGAGGVGGRATGGHHLARAWPEPLVDESNFGGHSTISTAKPADEWFAEAGRNLRAGLRKAGNRLAQHGEVRTTVAATPDEIVAAFDAYVRIEASGWKGRTGGGLANRPVERETLRAFFTSDPDHVEVRSLWAGDTLAAVHLSILVGPTHVLLKTSYADEQAAAAPGSLLLADLVRECCADEQVLEIDLVTNQPWHARWHPEVHPTYRRQAFNRRTVPGLAAGTAARARVRAGSTPPLAHR